MQFKKEIKNKKKYLNNNIKSLNIFKTFIYTKYKTLKAIIKMKINKKSKRT